MTASNPFGTHRVLVPQGALPQAAERLDNNFATIFEHELLIDVDVLNIDAASFKQMLDAAGGKLEGVAEAVRNTVVTRGKQHNPVTGSGGMLLGRVAKLGGRFGHSDVKVADRVATLVSLTLTPLRLDEVLAVHEEAAQLFVRGQAVIFASSPFCVIPSDLNERLVLAALDVAGAAPQVARICEPGESVLVLGAGGKSGILCAYEARRRVGPKGRVVGIESFARAADELRHLGLCDEVVVADARDAVAVREASLKANQGREFDRAISCVSVEGAEMSAILAVRPRGKIYFFSMTTSFTRAALGAEGVGRDIDMLIGNGFAEGHAAHTLQILRESEGIRALFEKRYT